jgi:hypothetical protein
MIRFPLFLAVLALVFAGSAATAGDKTSIHKRSLGEFKKNLRAILDVDNKGDERERALRKLKAYRYLAEVPYDDLILDEEYNKRCKAGTMLCAKLGRLEHKPQNPGLPEDEYELALKGTSYSNLAWGDETLPQAVSGWMFDSDASNIGRLGHRRWCLYPAMQKTGFGRTGMFSAMYAFDRSRADVPAFDFICFPVRGYMPIEFFGPEHAWSVTLNPKKYKTPSKDFTPKIYQADARGGKRGEALKLDFKNVDTTPFGIPNCIIFRPERLQLTAGRRFLVELEGIVPQGQDEPITLRYLVEFAKWK